MGMIARRWILAGCVCLLVGCVAPASPIGDSQPAPRQQGEQSGLPAPEWRPGDESDQVYEEIYENTADYVMERLPPEEGQNVEDLVPVTQYVPDQVILTGREEDITQVATAAQDSVPGLQQVSLPIGPVDEIVAIVYQFNTEANTVLSATEAIRAAALNEELLVFADPNYVAGIDLAQASSTVCANPMSGEASPMSGEASPLTGSASPFSVPAGMQLNEFFWRQWAFDPVGTSAGGIDLAVNGVRKNYPTGAGTDVVILDTSPFTQTGVFTFGGSDWFSPPLTLSVSHLASVNLTVTGGATTRPCSMSDHGLFVAGLAYAGAPDSRIRLLRVLNNAGNGDLGGILAALDHLNRTIRPRTVVNMSFGIVPFAPPIRTDLVAELCGQLMEELQIGDQECQNIRAIFNAWPNQATHSRSLLEQILDAFNLVMLTLEIDDLVQRDAVLVAAAGNRSNGGYALQAEVPAAYSQYYPNAVLGVAAGTSARDRAYYSNRGDIAAPGGGDNDAGCEGGPAAAGGACWNSAQDYVISVAVHEPTSGAAYFSFGAWAGTSFATPLVAGMAAAKRGTSAHPSAGDTVNAVRQGVCLSNPSTPAPAEFGQGLICFPP